MATSAQIQQNISRMEGQIGQLEGQIGLWSQRIAELKQDRSGLEEFQSRVDFDRGQFESTLARKRQVAARAGTIAHSRLALGMSAAMNARFNQSFEGGVQGCFGGVFRQIRSAIDRVNDEIRQLTANIASAEQEIAGLRRQIAIEHIAYERTLNDEARTREEGRR